MAKTTLTLALISEVPGWIGVAASGTAPRLP
jgi:hypothetical protein